jgi:hypothetical protein
VIALIVVGVVLYFVNTYVPMAGSIRGLLNVVVFLATLVGVLQAFGLWAPLRQMLYNLTHRGRIVS